MSYDPFDHFDNAFFKRPKRTVGVLAVVGFLAYLLFWLVIIAAIVVGVLVLKAHGVF